MSKGLCNNDESRLGFLEPSSVVDIKNILGAKVRVTSLTMSNGAVWKDKTNSLCTVESVSFRVSVDGKCFTVLTLTEHPGELFTLKDIEFVKLHE